MRETEHAQNVSMDKYGLDKGEIFNMIGCSIRIKYGHVLSVRLGGGDTIKYSDLGVIEIKITSSCRQSYKCICS